MRPQVFRICGYFVHFGIIMDTGKENFMKQKRMEQCTAVISGIMVFFLLAGLPLWCDGTYIRIATRKWELFRMITLGMRTHGILIPGLLVLLVLLFIWSDADKTERVRIGGWWGILFAADAVISAALATDKLTALTGFPGWYLGLYTQISLVLIYYLLAQKPVPLKPVMIVTGVVSSVIFGLEVLNRFYIYPFPVTDGLTEDQIKIMVSTIGNINWFAGYLSCIVPLAYASFLHTSGRMHVLSAGWVMITAAAMATQNSESIALALTAVMLRLLVLYRNDYCVLRKVMRAVILTAAAWLIIGLVYRFFPGKTVELDRICRLMMHPGMDLALIGTAGIADVLLEQRIRNAQHGNLSFHAALMMILFLAVLLLVILWIIDPHYFHFNYYWGNYRGLLWRITWESWLRILRENPLQALFGCGPDQYYHAVSEHYLAALEEVYHGQLLTTAHNEFLTSLIHFGAAGTVCYFGIFLHTIRWLLRAGIQRPELSAGALCVISYLANNLVSFQQLVSAPVIFCLMAVFLSHTASKTG